MQAAIDYIEIESRKNGSMPNRGNIEKRILKALNTQEKIFLMLNGKLLENKRKGR